MSQSIQIPQESAAVIRGLPSHRLHWIRQPTLLSEEIGLTGPIPRETDYEDTGGPFYLDPDGRHTDTIDDDLALWIRSDNGLVVCVGCSHAGLINTLHHIRRLNNGMRVRAIIGGFHLINAGRERLDRTVAALRLIEPDTVVPSHCTGEPAVTLLRDVFGERISTGVAGMKCRF
jgi:7,8-dihydropterin-6-yl-methyl-4-(beta-D-ribofuranosyl)aminobenzene 5'-phosphate synthase